jgi:CheY-like chemotaxis protein
MVAADFLERPSAAQRRSLTLIVADDDRDTVVTLSAILLHEGHSVFGVYKGPDAIAQARRYKPDALVIDIDMPGMSGYSVAREVRSLFGPWAPLLIGISGKWVGQTDRMLAELAGFNHFLLKPCDPQELLQLLEPLRARPPFDETNA